MDGDPEAVNIGIVEVEVEVEVVVVVAVAAAAGVLDGAFAATTMLKERLMISRPPFAVTRN